MKFSLKKTAWALAAAGLIFTPMAGEGMHAFCRSGQRRRRRGAIIVKNRDEHPMYQEMRYHQGHVYRYYGIYGGNEDHMSLTGGVNEAGFAVFSAVAEPIPKDVRLAYGKRGTLAALLGNCSSVKEALEMKDYFKSPGFFSWQTPMKSRTLKSAKTASGT